MYESVASGAILSVALSGQALQHFLFTEYLHALDLQVISLKAEFVDDRAWPNLRCILLILAVNTLTMFSWPFFVAHHNDVWPRSSLESGSMPFFPSSSFTLS
jgi:hypothetical protein